MDSLFLYPSTGPSYPIPKRLIHLQNFTARTPPLAYMPVRPITFVENFRGDGQSAEKWIDDVDAFFWLVNMPEEERLAYVLKYLSSEVLGCLYITARSVEKISGRRWEWDWTRLKIAMRGVEKQIKTSKSSGYCSSWLKALTLGAVVAVGGPVALGLTFAETAICALGAITLSRMEAADMKAKAIASEVGKSKLPPVAEKTIKEIWTKVPSKSWREGLKFNPSLELVIELLRTMGPEKNARS